MFQSVGNAQDILSIDAMRGLLEKNPMHYISLCEQDRAFYTYICPTLNKCRDQAIINAIPLKKLPITFVLALASTWPDLTEKFKKRDESFDVEATWAHYLTKDECLNYLTIYAGGFIVVSIVGATLFTSSPLVAVFAFNALCAFGAYLIGSHLKNERILQERLCFFNTEKLNVPGLALVNNPSSDANLELMTEEEILIGLSELAAEASSVRSRHSQM